MQYNQINLSINNQYIIADTVNISEQSPQKPIYGFNLNTPFDYNPTTLKGQISINYFLEPKIEPNYITLTGIISDTTNPLPSIINIGNTFITGYLNSYSLKLSPGNLIKISSSFDIYYPFTGNLIVQNTGDVILYDTSNSSGIANYWLAQFYSGGTIVSNNILQLDYDAKINLIPIYSIGTYIPSQIYINKVEESLNILTEQQINVSYTGQKWESMVPSLQSIILSGFLSNNYISIPLTDMILQEMSSDITSDNLIFFSTKLNRYT